MENLPKSYPFGLKGVGSAYQNAILHLLRDCITGLYMIDPTKFDQPAPVVNMVAIRQLMDDSLHDVLEESPDDYFEGSTKTTSTCPTFPLGFGGMISMSDMIAPPGTMKPLTNSTLA